MSDIVLVPSSSPSDGHLFTASARICGVCAQQYSKYKCPRCALQYCCLACYRTHGEACTEGFYADRAREELKGTRAPAEQQLDMLRKLQRLDATASDGSSDEADEEDADAEGEGEASAGGGDNDDERLQRLQGLLAQATIDEAELSEPERVEFRRLLADGSLGAQLQATPAWWSQLPAGAVVPTASRGASVGWCFSTTSAATAAQAAGAPQPPATLPSLSSLTKREPPATLMYNLLEVLCAYVYTWRLFCGASIEDDPLAAAASLLSLSDVLNGEQRGAHPSSEEALLRFARATEGGTVATSAAFTAACLADASSVLDDDGATALALAACTALLTAAVRTCHHARGDGGSQRSAHGAGGRGRGGGEGDEQVPAADAVRRAALLGAKRKVHFLEVWWTARRIDERRGARETLQFSLRLELHRREEVRRATTAATAAAARRGTSGPPVAQHTSQESSTQGSSGDRIVPLS